MGHQVMGCEGWGASLIFLREGAVGLHSQGTWLKGTPLPLEGLDIAALVKNERVDILVIFPYAR